MKSKLRKWIATFGALALAFGVFVAPINSCKVSAASSTGSTVSVAKPGFGRVDISSGTLNVRQYASTNAGIVASLANNTMIMIVGESGNFYKVQYDVNGQYGYISKDYTIFFTRDYYLKVNNITGNMNLRELNSTDSPIIASLPANTCFAYFSDTGSEPWYRGVYGNVLGSASKHYATRYDF